MWISVRNHKKVTKGIYRIEATIFNRGATLCAIAVTTGTAESLNPMRGLKYSETKSEVSLINC